MKRVLKKSISALLSVIMLLSTVNVFSVTALAEEESDNVTAEISESADTTAFETTEFEAEKPKTEEIGMPATTDEITPKISSNLGEQNYPYYWSSTVKSNLIDNGDGTLTRVEYCDDEVVVEDYDIEFNLLNQNTIEPELPIYGGYYSGADYNFLVFGQENPDEDDSVEVIRVVRYTKKWERIDSVSLYGANTTIPFDGGSLRMIQCGDMLYIRTCHKMYTSSDGLNHQANLTFSIKISTMEITDKFSGVWLVDCGYVSHSFNQFIDIDGNDIIALDHGDAYPRSLVLVKYEDKAGETTFVSTDCPYVEALKIKGGTGANETGVTVGDFAVTETSYLIAGSTVAQDDTYDPSSTPNIFVSSTDKNNFTEDGTKINCITDYASDEDIEVSTPHLVKVSDNKYLLMWTVQTPKDEYFYWGKCATTNLNYVFLDNCGNIISETYSTEGFLSDCDPIVVNNKVIWYVTNNTEPLFYTMDLDNPEQIETSRDVNTIILTYSIENGEATITGFNRLLPEELTIPSQINGVPVTSIANDVFKNTSLKKVILPDSLKSIGDYAFFNCSNLTDIIIPDKVTSIGMRAFSYCTNLESITFSDSISSIGQYAFLDTAWYDNQPDGILYIGKVLYKYKGEMPEDTEIILEDGIAGIAGGAFYGCSNLKSITIPKSVTNIGSDAFSGVYSYYNFEDVYYTGSVSDLCKISFGDKDSHPNANANNFYILGDLDFSADDNIEKIDDCTFSNCQSITSITIPNGVTSIGDDAFFNCRNLINLTIPASVTRIGSDTCANCSDLENLYYNGSVSDWCNILFDGYNSHLTRYADNFYILGDLDFSADDNIEKIDNYTFRHCKSIINITIPDSVTSIGDGAFYDCSNLASITIPDNVTSIGEGVFIGCSSLENIAVEENNTSYCSIDGVLFNKDISVLICYPPQKHNTYYKIPDGVISIDDWAFEYCENLTSITIPDGVTSIGNGAFDGCSSIESITIPNGVTSIHNYTFYNCASLASITIPNSLTSIGDNAFWGCYGLENVYYNGSVSEWCKISHGSDSYPNYYADNFYILGDLDFSADDNIDKIDDYTFENCRSLESITIPDSVTSIGASAFRGCENLESIITPDSATSIGNSAFRGCTSLTDITIPDGVTSIGDWAFYGCESLGSITIPDSITSIGYCAFGYCTNLEDIIIPDSVISIDNGAFEYCTSLTSITIPDGITSISYGAFEYCKSLTSITIPDSVTLIDDYAFSYCTNLVSVTIPDSVTEIGGSAFESCRSLKSITIPDSVTSIGYNAFSGCTNLTSATIPDGITSIGYHTFEYCTSLESITIPDSVTSIGKWAFNYCNSLSEVYYASSEDEWNSIDIGDSNKNLTSANIHYNTVADDYVLSEVVKEADCTTNGEYVYNCPHGYTKTKIIPALKHTGTVKQIVEPTCTEYGYTIYICDRCGEEYKDDYVDALGHNIEDGVCTRCKRDKNECTESAHPYDDDSDESWVISNPGVNNMRITFSSQTEVESYYDYIEIYDGNNELIGQYTGDELASRSILIDGDKATIKLVSDKYVSCYGFSIDKIEYNVEEDVMYWEIDDNGTLYISGSGVINPDEYSIEDDIPWYSQRESIKNIVIEDGITGIGNYSFMECCNLEKITIPASVTEIGDWAFDGCDNFTIYGHSNTIAETYATENNIEFIALDESTPDEPATPDETVKIKGDVNSDGEYNIRDAAAIQLKIAQLYNGTFDDSVADVNGDGDIDIKDAAYIQLDLAKLL